MCNNKPKNKKVATKQDIPVVQERNDSFDSDELASGRQEPEVQEDIDFLQDINATFLERRKINELGVGETYVVEHLERITTKYGPSLLATLDDEGDRFKVFLPKRFNNKFTDKRIKYVNKNTLHLEYLGGYYNDLEFAKRKGRGQPVLIG